MILCEEEYKETATKDNNHIVHMMICLEKWKVNKLPKLHSVMIQVGGSSKHVLFLSEEENKESVSMNITITSYTLSYVEK